MMCRLAPVIIALLILGCAAQKVSELDQAILDYVQLHELSELDSLRRSNGDSWKALSDRFVVYSGRKDVYLIEFNRNCHELNEYPVVADVRREPNRIRARFDTLRGCLIDRIFAINENDVAELAAMGQAMDNEN